MNWTHPWGPALAGAGLEAIEAELKRFGEMSNPLGTILADREESRARVNMWEMTVDGKPLCVCCCRFPVVAPNDEWHFLACARCIEVNRKASRKSLADPMLPFERLHEAGCGELHLCVDLDDEEEDEEIRRFGDDVLELFAFPDPLFEHARQLAGERALQLPDSCRHWPDIPAHVWQADANEDPEFCARAYLRVIHELLPAALIFSDFAAGRLRETS